MRNRERDLIMPGRSIGKSTFNNCAQDKTAKRSSENVENGPVASSVITKGLVSADVKTRDILDHHGAYLKSTNKVTSLKVLIYDLFFYSSHHPSLRLFKTFRKYRDTFFRYNFIVN